MERSTRRIAKLKSELEAETGLLEQSRARLARLEVQQAAPVRDSVVGDGPQVSSLQQMVIQLQAERDSLSQELRRSRGPHARPCGDGLPNVSNIPPLPDQAQDVEQWMNARNFDLRDALEFGSPAVISSNLLAQGAAKLASFPRGGVVPDPNAMEVVTGQGGRMSALIDAADAKRRCLDVTAASV